MNFGIRISVQSRFPGPSDYSSWVHVGEEWNRNKSFSGDCCSIDHHFGTRGRDLSRFQNHFIPRIILLPFLLASTVCLGSPRNLYSELTVVKTNQCLVSEPPSTSAQQIH